MTVYELMNTRHTIEAKRDNLQKGYEVANDRACTYYNEHLLPAEEDTAISDEEMSAIYDTYDDLCATATRFEGLIEIAEWAIEALNEAESALGIAIAEEVWKEG